MQQESLKGRYMRLLDELAEEFARIMEKEGYWLKDYTLWATEFEAWSVEDMMYIVTNYKTLVNRYGDWNDTEEERLELLRNDINLWIDYNVDVANFGINYINLKSWLMGAPRMSQVDIDKLKEAQRKLDELVGEFRECYGRLRTESQPEHLYERLKKK